MAVLASWRLRSRVSKEVQRRVARFLRSSLEAAWRAWRRYQQHKVGEVVARC